MLLHAGVWGFSLRHGRGGLSSSTDVFWPCAKAETRSFL
jgi:hypothetical protein